MIKRMLLFGAVVNFLLFAGHVLCLFCLERAFSIYGINDVMNGLAASCGTLFPYLVTMVIALCFFAAGLYGLSCGGYIGKLPLLKCGVSIVATVFLFRTIWGISMLMGDFSLLELSSTAVSAVVGVPYLLGGIKSFSLSVGCSTQKRARGV